MLLKIVYLCVAAVCVFGAPPTDVVPLEKQQPTVIPILLQSEELEANGTYKYSYETGNGIKREEISYDKVLPRTRSGASSEDSDKSDESNEIHVQQGSYSYTAPDGTLITVRYIADENGFQPIGDHLPKPPSILSAASSATVSGRKAKTADNAESGSVPAVVVAAAPSAPAESASIQSAPAQSAPVQNAPASSAPASEPVIVSRLAEQASSEPVSHIASVASASAPEAPSTTEVPSTAEPIPSTTEAGSTTTEQASSSEVTSAEQSSTTGAASTPEEPVSTPAATPSNASAEAATTISA